MEEYTLLFSKYLNSDSGETYDVIAYNNKFYAGSDLFKHFSSYLAQMWDSPVIKFSHYHAAKKHFSNYCEHNTSNLIITA